MKTSYYTLFSVLAALLWCTPAANAQTETAFDFLGPFGGNPWETHTFDDGRMILFVPFETNHFQSLDSGETWQPAGSALAELINSPMLVQTSNGSVFAAAAGNTVQYSWDGGRSWVPYKNHEVAAPIMVAHSLAAGPNDLLYMGGADLTLLTSHLYRSTQGAAWEPVSELPGVLLPQHIVADDQGTIAVVGRSLAGDHFLYSNDSGSTWTELYTTEAFNGEAFIMPDGSVLVLEFLTGIRRLDPVSGETTLVREADLPQDVLILDDQSVLVTADSLVLRSEDNGVTWTELAAFEADAWEFGAAPNGDIFLTTANSLFKSRDGGSTWESASGDIGFLGTWGVGRSASGELLVGTGQTLLLSSGGQYDPVTAIDVNDDGTVQFVENRDSGDYALTQVGDLYVREAGSTDWDKRRDSDRRIWGFDLDAAGDVLAISGTQDMWVSSDAGYTWTNHWDAVPTGEFNGWDVAVSFSGSLFMTADDGLFRSTDLGVTWSQVLSTPLREVHALSGGEIMVSDRDQAWISDDDGATFAAIDYDGSMENVTEMPDGTVFSSQCDGLLRSDDQGHSWTVQASWGSICHEDSHIDADGTIWLSSVDTGLYRSETPVFVSNEPASELPAERSLLEAYPNPFVGALRFSVSIPTAGVTRIELFDLLGRRVLVAVDESLPSGPHTLEAHPRRLPPGAYVARLTVDGTTVASRTVIRAR